ncbi:InlB B-repeat-containing protein [Oscillibacter sp. MSJ-31]|uniref:InlB B-repeat-containing protein n=1 Tax=Oscillibacter sp. MSJ-31 TaxID=2841526 RepID=UPI001C11FA5F|nr:InlB B-repeat-containing protein [Oscillibacter sp. MSJ-31]MBU5456215.1 InlB B-repeat-containing protein [Oscillibacter sp. MSJ-31]
MHSQKMRLLSLNLVLAMLFTMVPVQAADIVIDDDGPLHTVVLNGNGGTYGNDETLAISYGYSALYLEDYIFTREGYTLLGWSENEDASTLDYTCFHSIWGGDVGEDEPLDLYAVWGEGTNCALYNMYIANSTPLSGYYALNSATLPTVNDVGFVGWYDHTGAFYKAGSAVHAGEEYQPVYASTGNYPILLDGNGGESAFGSSLFFAGTTGNSRINTAVWDHGKRIRCFSKDGYLLAGWANSDGNTVVGDNGELIGLCIPNSDGIITLYAQWDSAYQLVNGTELVIDGDDMTELLEGNAESYGSGWRFYSWNDLRLSSPYGTSTPYAFDRMAYNDDLDIRFSGTISTGQIEVNGRLCFYEYGNRTETSIDVITSDIPAIHAVRIMFMGVDNVYRISTENAVGIDARSLYFASPNLTITGEPAVREDAKITCDDGIGYTISDDGTTLTTYAIDQNVTLDGNGGTFEGEKTISCDYSVSDELDLSHYAFTREGYVLIGWAADADGSDFVSESSNTSYSRTGYQTLYAVWLEVPENHIVFRTTSGASLTTYKSAYEKSTLAKGYSVAIDDDFTMPVAVLNGQQQRTVWWNAVDRSLFYGGESYTPASGSVFWSDISGNIEDGCHTVIIDGNGGTYRDNYYDNGIRNWYNTNRVVAAWSAGNGDVINYAYSFTRQGYTLVSYNSEPDGSGTEYALNRCTVTADMDPIQILYAQWEKIEESGLYITIDGKQYDAAQNWNGAGWVYRHYENNYNELTLDGYIGGSIESDVELRVNCESKKSVVTGSICAPHLEVNLIAWHYVNGNVDIGSLSVCANDGVALMSQGDMNINVPDSAVLSVAGAEGSPAIKTDGELTLWYYGEGRLSAQGGNTAAISAACINNERGYDCVITAGTNPDDAVEVETYSGQQYVSYEIRTKTLTLHGSGGKADGKDSISIDTKEGYIDLSQYRNSFSSDGKVLLGWSRNAGAAGIDYANESNVGFGFDNGVSQTDLYAVWESDSQKGIVLNDFGQVNEKDSENYSYYDYYEYFTDAVSAGTTYTLPDSYKAGYAFKGWSDGATMHSVGEQISVDESRSFTAVYEVLSLTIDGKTYRMDKACGSRSLGWEYEPAYRYGYWDNQVQLTVYENYSGKLIIIPSNAYIRLNGNISGANGQPAILVDGNAQIRSDAPEDGQKTVTITGGAEAPAVQVSGKLTVDLNYLWDSCGMSLIMRSDIGQPTLKAKAVNIGVDSLLFAGSSESDAVLTGAYNDQSYVRISDSLILKAGQTVPSMQNKNGMKFVAWRQKGSADWDNAVWYRPGDVIEGNEKMLVAEYTSYNLLALIFDGNGGTTASGSKYYVTEASSGDLQLIDSPFTRDGYSLQSYNDRADGSGTSYTAQQLVEKQDWFDVMVGKVLTFFAQWTKNSGSEPTTPDEPEKTPDGSASYTVSDSTVTIKDVDMDKLLTESGGENSAALDLSGAGAIVKEVSLPTEVIQEISTRGADDLTIRLPGASVSFDEKALSAVAAQSEGESLSLNVNIGGRESLTGAQHEAVAKAKDLSVIEVSLSSDGKKISDFSGGNVTIDIPFEWSMQGLLCAYYIDDNGNKTAIDVTYKNGIATLVLKHFSTYVVELLDASDDTAMILATNSVTVKTAGKGADQCIAAIYAADGKLLTIGVSPITAGEDFTTVAYSAEKLSEQQLLNVFFLNESYQPVSETLSLPLKE